MTFSKILVANRGEIAARVIRSAQALGYETVAVFSDADAEAPHVALADEAIHIGASAASESYLNVETILAAAARCGADALHPGYGFLSENSEFSGACAAAGITFIGPSPEAITAMGDKAVARRKMTAAGVPCVPGYDGDAQDDDALSRAATDIGYPLLVKAAAGGGGRGMRRVNAAEELEGALASARREADKAFGDPTLLLEKLVVDARHIEIQIIADRHGTVLHLGERDCSTQRRYQKVIEEAPSPAVSAQLRDEMGAAAVSAAQSINYEGAGTVELLLGADESFYFLEMNTRLQVEHPVTELVTGFDLVELQIQVAAGNALPFAQSDVELRGHAIEARLYAEDPYASYAPQSGEVLVFEPPEGSGVRCDHGLDRQATVSNHYDAMVAKVITWGETREDARRRLARALRQTTLLGLSNNKRQLIDIISHSSFRNGAITTGFLEGTPELTERPERSSFALPVAAFLLADVATPARDGWSLNHASYAPVPVILDDDEAVNASLTPHADGGWIIRSGDDEWALKLISRDEHALRFEINGHRFTAKAALSEATTCWFIEVEQRTVRAYRALPKGAVHVEEESDGSIRSPFSGAVVSVSVSVGQRVKRGSEAVVIEAMKIESPMPVPGDGVVTEVRVSAGDQVTSGQVLVVIDPDETEDADA